MLAAALLSLAATPARADVLPAPDASDALIGATTTLSVSGHETLLDVARRHGLGYEDIVRANPDVDPWVPEDGAEVLLPLKFVLPDAPRAGVVLNLAEYRLYYYPPGAAGDAVMTYPVSIGRMDWATPLGATRVTAKAKNPTWYPPASVRAEHAADGRPLPPTVPPGPDNPLGSRAIRLGIPGYLIHGTNRPAGVGMRVTHGCVRMFPEDIEFVYEHIAVNTPVRIVDQPLKAGWRGDTLYLEAHPALGSLPENAPPEEEFAVAAEPAELTELTRVLVAATRERAAEIDWERAAAVVRASRGVPVAIGVSRAEPPAELAAVTN